MPYQSPVHILSYFDAGWADLNPQGIRRLQQKIMAEFALDSGQTMLINNQRYSKDDLLKTIDRLKQESYAKIHQTLCSNKLALRFLENSQEQGATRFVKQFFDGLKNEAGFPYLQELIFEALTEHLKINIPLNQFNYCANCLTLIELLTIDQQQEVYKQIEPPLKEYIENLKYEIILLYHELMHNMSDGELTNYLNPSLISNPIAALFNQLPSQFYELKSNYVNACLELIKQCLTTGNSMQKFIEQLVAELKKINDLEANLRYKIDNYQGRSMDSTTLLNKLDELIKSNNQNLAANHQTEQQTDKEAGKDNSAAILIKLLMVVMVLLGINYGSVTLMVLPIIILILIVREEQRKKKKRA